MHPLPFPFLLIAIGPNSLHRFIGILLSSLSLFFISPKFVHFFFIGPFVFKINFPIFSFSMKMQSPLYSSFLILLLICLMISPSFGSFCHAKCSPHFTLPCTFGSFDKCLAQSCRELCAKDGGRKMIDCFCRGTVEGPTYRACFCAGNKRPTTF